MLEIHIFWYKSAVCKRSCDKQQNWWFAWIL